MLHRVVREHLETFLAEARLRGGGEGLPWFVERELREFLTCGDLARGFARFRCNDCGHEILVAFSCKGRGFCPSCCGRPALRRPPADVRMAELSAHLVDGVLGGLPVRQWVLTLPYRLRYALAWDHRLCRSVLGVFIRAVLGFERRRAARRGVRNGTGGAVTAIQRFGSALNTNVHFHTLAVQGVFAEGPDGALRLAPAPAPTEADVARLLATVRRRIVRLVARHGIDLEQLSREAEATDERRLDFPAYAEIQGAAVAGRVATGRRAGAPVARVGLRAMREDTAVSAPLHAHMQGFDLHAGVAVPAGDRKRLEYLCRYVLRPPIAQERLELTPEGKVLLRLRRPWGDGTRAIRFEPIELLEKLASMVPKPRVNLLLYHGMFAPHARNRSGAVRSAPQGARRLHTAPGACTGPDRATTPGAPSADESQRSPQADIPSLAGESRRDADAHAAATARPPPLGSYMRPKHYAWAKLLERTFEIDVLACPDCGGRLRFVATVQDTPARGFRRAGRAVVEKILRMSAESGWRRATSSCPSLSPARRQHGCLDTYPASSSPIGLPTDWQAGAAVRAAASIPARRVAVAGPRAPRGSP